MIKKNFNVLLYIILAFILITGILLVILTVTDYRPEGRIRLKVSNNIKTTLKTDVELSIITFNIGYCGLDKNQDFFMDGGTMSRSSGKSQTITNLEKITGFLARHEAEAILLQELDINSTRSFNINELEYMEGVLKGYSSTFGQNYKVPWVPVPLKMPMGAVNSGLVTFCKYFIKTAVRHQYPIGETWPVQLFELDRCFIENRIAVEGGKELILINSHLSAFDKDGRIRKEQLSFLKSFITEEYSKGNYVIVGGDWNHQLPGVDSKNFPASEDWPFWLQKLPSDFTPEGFKWGVDKNIPTNRTVAKAYVKGENFLSAIDGFLVSPNVEIKNLRGYDLGFENSDHNPVSGIFVLK